MPTTLRATTRVASTTTTTGRGYGRVTGKRAHTGFVVRRSTGGETTAATEASTKEEDGKPAPPEMKSEVRIGDTRTTRLACDRARAMDRERRRDDDGFVVGDQRRWRRARVDATREKSLDRTLVGYPIRSPRD